MAKAIRTDSGIDFTGTDYGKDFEACSGVVLEGRPEGSFDDIWFKAYDTSLRENERESGLSDGGYAYECVVMFRPDGALYGPDVLPPRGARTREEAEAYLMQAFEGIRDGSIDVPVE